MNEINFEKTSSLEDSHDSISFSSTIRHIYLSLNDEKNISYKSKCTSMTIDFGEKSQDIGEIFFKNYYTHIVSVLVMKMSNTEPNRLQKWYTSIKKKVMWI